MSYFDYRFRFPSDPVSVSTALRALSFLRNRKLLEVGVLPLNMLGEPLNNRGEPTTEDRAAFFGSHGGVDGGQKGWIYIHVRSRTDLRKVPFQPGTYGMMEVSEEESAEVLGRYF